MAKICCRETHFIDASNPGQVDFLIEKIKETVEKMKLSPDYDVRIYRNVYSCCGIGGLGLIIEVAGPEEEKMKEIDKKTVATIMEYCERYASKLDHNMEKFECIDTKPKTKNKHQDSGAIM